MSWKIRWEEIEQINLERSNYDFDHEVWDNDDESNSIKTVMNSVVTGIYKGNQVVIKKLHA
ncbi:hypothetical protein BLA29_006988 [Euroglyphus maynei]|uniref:Uncharacterized protein n=1 Tax=Euroglyphus maynei TaxID=6958 RepID=A0A1Y3BAH6_EURMA|nr:hypothetical protein BLA29_006988 [Euroglyphus maynei]